MTLKSAFRWAIALLFALSFTEGLRQAVLLRLLDTGYPQLAAGESSLAIRRIDWAEGQSFVFMEMKDDPQIAELNGWQASFPSGPLVANYDTTCGVDCERALVARGMRCTPPITSGVFSSYGCSLHLWKSGAEESCFFSVDDDLPKQHIAGMEVGLPRELPMKCPSQLAWVPK
jgi:hypothetical protein